MEGHENGHGHIGESKLQFQVPLGKSDIRTSHYVEQIARGTDILETKEEEGADEKGS